MLRIRLTIKRMCDSAFGNISAQNKSFYLIVFPGSRVDEVWDGIKKTMHLAACIACAPMSNGHHHQSLRVLSIPPKEVEANSIIWLFNKKKAAGLEKLPTDPFDLDWETPMEPITLMFRNSWNKKRIPISRLASLNLLTFKQRAGAGCRNHRGINFFPNLSYIVLHLLTIIRKQNTTTGRIIPGSQLLGMQNNPINRLLDYSKRSFTSSGLDRSIQWSSP